MQQPVCAYEVKDKSLYPVGQVRVVQECREVKIVREEPKVACGVVFFKIGGQKVVKIHIGHYSGVAVENRAQHLYSFKKYRMRIRKAVNLSVKQNSPLYIRRIILMTFALYKISDKVTHLQLPVVT